MRYFILLLIISCSVISRSFGQTVPEEFLKEVISEYTSDGFKLEEVFRPDLSLEHPNVSSRLMPCYIGRKALIIVLMANKPADMSFQVKSLGTLGKTEPIQTLPYKGKTYWMDFRVVAFSSDMPDKSNHCLFIQAVDKANFKLPVYTIILTHPL